MCGNQHVMCAEAFPLRLTGRAESAIILCRVVIPRQNINANTPVIFMRKLIPVLLHDGLKFYLVNVRF